MPSVLHKIPPSGSMGSERIWERGAALTSRLQSFQTELLTQEENRSGLAAPKRIENWSLTSLQQRLVKTGGRLVKYARYYWLFLAERHLTRRRFGAVLVGSRCYRYRRDRWIVVHSAAESVDKLVG